MPHAGCRRCSHRCQFPLSNRSTIIFRAPRSEVRVGALETAKPLLLSINDGLMAVFFFLVGLELKREIVEGGLSDARKIILPGVGAVGEWRYLPWIYILFNSGDWQALNGWVMPAATDIAFALGIMSLLGPQVSISILPLKG